MILLEETSRSLDKESKHSIAWSEIDRFTYGPNLYI